MKIYRLGVTTPKGTFELGVFDSMSEVLQVIEERGGDDTNSEQNYRIESITLERLPLK